MQMMKNEVPKTNLNFKIHETQMCQRFVNFEVKKGELGESALKTIDEYIGAYYRDSERSGLIYHKVMDSAPTAFLAKGEDGASTVSYLRDHPEEKSITLCMIIDPTRSLKIQHCLMA